MRRNFCHSVGRAFVEEEAELVGVGLLGVGLLSVGAGEDTVGDDDDADDGGVQPGAWLTAVEPHGTGPLFVGTPDAGRPIPSTDVEQAASARATSTTAARRMIIAAD